MERVGGPPVACEIYLRMKVVMEIPGQEPIQVRVLVDTGAEVSLVRQGLLPEGAMREAKRPLKLVAANNQRLPGGRRVAEVGLRFEAELGREKKEHTLTAPSELYEAAMEEDVILSYQWLAERDIDVCPRKHGLRMSWGHETVWMPADREKALPRVNARLERKPVYVHAAQVTAEEARGPALRALDLFCGRKSVAKTLEKWGYQVETLDVDPKREPTVCVDIMKWDYKAQYPPGYFHLVASSPPCTEYSAAKTTSPRDLEKADAIVKKTIEIIEYLQPARWWLETPRGGILARRPFMQHYPRVDVDYCQFEECGFRKPTRFFGSDHLGRLPSVVCDQKTCTSLVPKEEGATSDIRPHLWAMGGKKRGVRREIAYHIPEGVVEYVAGLGLTCDPPAQDTAEEESEPDPELEEEIHRVRFLRLRALPEEAFEEGDPETEYEVLREIAKRTLEAEKSINQVKGGPEAVEKSEHPLAKQLRQALLDEFGDTCLSGKYKPNPPVRGPFGEAEIWLKPDVRPVSVPPYQLSGERREALTDLVNKAREMGKIEDGKGPWNTPAFPVPKTVAHRWRLVQDFRPQNEATLKDGHPLPRIGDIIQRQGKNLLWTTLDLVDGFHQMPLKKEHRYITCMSTPRGTQQWTVQVMGLKNAGTQFQRMMEWELREHPDADPYVDDIIDGSRNLTEEETLWDNYHSVRAVLLDFRRDELVCHPDKSEFFQKKVQFCGHLLEKGKRSPAPGKLLPIQKWELPRTVTELRGFLGLTNYFSEYVHHYAEVAAPLMGKLRLNREDGKKGSKLRLLWTAEEKAAFEKLKARLCERLELWQVDLDKPFQLHSDASEHAIGAELRQEIEGKWRPVALFSRKLGGSQRNWVVREKETYAIVAALRKWAGIIGFQPVEVLTDHQSLQYWTTEHVDTPSGPRGRRARWHETLSKFDLVVKYVPGPENVVADALSRWAYPASSAREDVSIHGSAAAKLEVEEMERREKEEELRVGEKWALEQRVGVVTRQGTRVEPSEEEAEGVQEGEAESPIVVPPPSQAPRGAAPGEPLRPRPRALRLHPDPVCPPPAGAVPRPKGEAPRFRFAPVPPGAQPCGPASEAARAPRRPVQGLPVPRRRSQPEPVLAADWARSYLASPIYKKVWEQLHSPTGERPAGFKNLKGKLYYGEKLCVPEAEIWRLVREHHEWNGHVNNTKLAHDMELRFEFPPTVGVAKVLDRVRKNCLVCQASHPPNWSVKQPIVMTPIPPRVMSSVCLDVFSMPEVEWEGVTYDAFLLCVDRHSGWTIARPTQKAGLTGEKAAHLLLDSSWGELGVPSVITTDQGAQFTSQWFQTMCGRLGIRLAFSQAHRPQANGRAEVAGRTLQDLLRKIHQDSKANWVEALPRALRIHHDTVDPVMGISPYQAIFGRERPLAGLPWRPELECEDANDFFLQRWPSWIKRWLRGEIALMKKLPKG